MVYNSSHASWIDQSWEIVQERSPASDFIPMEVEVFKEDIIVREDQLLQERFDQPIHYANGPRSHRSTDEVRLEQSNRLEQEKELAGRVYFTQEQIDQMLHEAYQRGKAESAEQEAMEYQTKLMAIEESILTVIKDLSAQEKELIVETEKSALDLSLQVAKKIIEEAVEINPEYILQVLKESLRMSGGAKIKKVRVSTQDLEFIKIFRIAESIREFDGSWEFEADESIKAGCVLESSAGIIDYQLEHAWERIRDKVLTLRK